MAIFKMYSGTMGGTYRKSIISDISDDLAWTDGCEFFPKTSTIILKSNERV